MREKWIDIGILLLALALLAAITLPSMPVRYAPEPDLPARKTVSGGGIVVSGEEILIDVNTAGVSLLGQLPGIGPVMAQRIIDHRQQNGPFSCAQDLLDVKGIGKATLAEILPYISPR